MKNGFVSVNFGRAARQGVGQSLGKAAIVSMYLFGFDAAKHPPNAGVKARHRRRDYDEPFALHTGMLKRHRFCGAFGTAVVLSTYQPGSLVPFHTVGNRQSNIFHNLACSLGSRSSCARTRSLGTHHTSSLVKYSVAVRNQFIDVDCHSRLPYEEEITPTPVSFMLAGGFFKKLRLFSRKIVGSSLVKSMRGVCTQSNAQ